MAFANYLAELAVSGGPIYVEVEPFGNSRPLVPYPVATAELTAGEWNQAARRNQRVEVKLVARPTAE